jgi:hypothetical protein
MKTMTKKLRAMVDKVKGLIYGQMESHLGQAVFEKIGTDISQERLHCPDEKSPYMLPNTPKII